MRKLLSALVVFCVVNISLKAQDNKEINADAVFNKILKEYILNTDGSSEFHCIKEVKLLTYNSIHRLYGETFIIYNPDFQELKINACYTIMADGKKVITPLNAFNEVLPRNAANAPVFNQLKEMVVTHTALERGSTIYLDYSIKSKKGLIPVLMGQEELVEYGPVTSYDVKVKVPEGTPLNFRLYHIKGDPVLSLDGYRRVYAWHFDNIKAYIPEIYQPDNSKFIPSLVFTTAKDMNQVISGFTAQKAFQFTATESMKSWGLKIQSENPGELKTVLALQEKIINEFNLYSLPLNAIGYKVRNAEEVWKSAGGTECEKALLFAALLNSLGISAEAIASFGGYYDIGLGNLSGMNHVYVQVNFKDKSPLLLSVTEQNDQNLLLKKTLSFVPLKIRNNSEALPSIQYLNSIQIKGKLELDKENTCKSKLTIHKEGIVNPYLLLERNESKITSGIYGLGASDFLTYKIVEKGEETTEITAKIEKKSAAKKEGEYYFFNWPLAESALSSWHLGEMVDDRKNPLEIPFPVTESYSFEMELPSHWTLINPLEAVSINNSAGQLKSECKIEKGKVFWNSEIKMYESPVVQSTTDYYKNVKEILSRWNTLTTQGSIFKSGK